MRTGDLIGTGTLSGEVCLSEIFNVLSLIFPQDTTSLCSLVEQRKHFPNRMFLQDGDEVVFTAWCGSPQGRVGFGECRGVVLPARL
jgi:fumarylacetoacetase